MGEMLRDFGLLTVVQSEPIPPSVWKPGVNLSEKEIDT